MTWRDNLQQGSYRGATFYWQRADGEVGRKTARHDYPLRDDCFVEDLGMLPSEFVLDVLVIGPNYMSDRDTLIEALQKAGPATLVHPTMGTLQVALNGKVRVHESTHEGGLCRFNIPLVVAGENQYPTSATDSEWVVGECSDRVESTASSTFASDWVVGGVTEVTG